MKKNVLINPLSLHELIEDQLGIFFTTKIGTKSHFRGSIYPKPAIRPPIIMTIGYRYHKYVLKVVSFDK